MVGDNTLIPFVIEKEGRHERSYDIYSRLLKDRIIFLGGSLSDATSNVIIAQMLFLANEDSKTDIHFYINSAGGAVSAGLAVYDTMQFVRPDVATYTIGMAASMGAILMCGGTRGKRFVLPHSQLMLHQPLIGGVMEGTATDLAIEAEEILRLRSRIYDIIAKHTEQDPKRIEKDCDRNKWLNASEAIEYGLADQTLEHMPLD